MKYTDLYEDWKDNERGFIKCTLLTRHILIQTVEMILNNESKKLRDHGIGSTLKKVTYLEILHAFFKKVFIRKWY